MSLKGNLSSVNLTEIFQMLSLSGREGTLFIYEGSRKRAICFTKEGVSIRSRERNENLLIGKILVRMGSIDEEQLHLGGGVVAPGGGDAGRDVFGLVQGGDDDGNEHRIPHMCGVTVPMARPNSG